MIIDNVKVRGWTTTKLRGISRSRHCINERPWRVFGGQHLGSPTAASWYWEKPSMLRRTMRDSTKCTKNYIELTRIKRSGVILLNDNGRAHSSLMTTKPLIELLMRKLLTISLSRQTFLLQTITFSSISTFSRAGNASETKTAQKRLSTISSPPEFQNFALLRYLNLLLFGRNLLIFLEFFSIENLSFGFSCR